MRKTCFRRMMALCLMLAVMLTCTLPALAEGGTLTIEMLAMYATRGGTYLAQEAQAEFEIRQGDRVLGTARSGETVSLDVTGRVMLYPIPGTYPEYFLMSEKGYSALIAAGADNHAPVVVYTDAGLFTVDAGRKASFTLSNMAGEAVLKFQTDEQGVYAHGSAIPAGLYTLTMTTPAGLWSAKTVEIVAYSGEESITRIDANYVYTPSGAAQATAAPRATAEPAAAPSEQGTLVINSLGDGASISCVVKDRAGNVATVGEMTGSTPFVADLTPGRYTVILTLPAEAVLTELDGIPLKAFGQVEMSATVVSGKISEHSVTAKMSAAIRGVLVDVPGETLMTITSASSVYMAEAYDEYAIEDLPCGTYDIMLHLPHGEYIAEGYRIMPDEDRDGVAASITVSLYGKDVTLPTITRAGQGAVSGVVADEKGNALPGVTVYLAGGKEAWTLTTDENGAWAKSRLPYGEYTVEYVPAGGQNLRGSAFALTETSPKASLFVSAGKLVQLTAFAFDDANNNGTKGNAEDGLEGVRMSLVSVDGKLTYDSGVTDARGYVTLSAPEGDCRLKVEAPRDRSFGKKGTALRATHSIMAESTDGVQTSDVITLEASKELEVGVGLEKQNAVSGTIWHDADENGLWDEGEAGIPGVRMTLHGVRNGKDYEAVSDANGMYYFGRVAPGTYDLTCYVPDEYVFTGKAKGDIEVRSRMTTEADREGVLRVEVKNGKDLEDHNVGLISGLTIEGLCFVDMNGNGQYDAGDKPLPGVELKLSRQSNNVLLQSTVSDENGRYRFIGQRGSTFAIRAILPMNHTFSRQGTGEDGNWFPPLESGKREQKIGNIEVASGGYERVLIGAVSLGSIEGVVYYDDNYSGAWEKGEKIATSKTVALYNAEGERVASMKTSKAGVFSFKNLIPGTYSLRMNPEGGKAFTLVGKGNVMRNVSDDKGESIPIILGNGESLTHQDIGMMIPGRIEGTVFTDENDNGKKDKGEKGMPGVTVILMNQNGEVDRTEVAENGEFAFPGVVPGEYRLVYDLPEGVVLAQIVKGGNQVGPEAATEFFTVAAKKTYEAPLCGVMKLGAITGYAYSDPNGNGQLDNGEAFQAGLTLILRPESKDQEPVIVSTGDDGVFAITGIRPGAYTLTVMCPADTVLSRVHNVALPLAQGKQEQAVKLEVEMGQSWLDQHLGCVAPSNWSGSAWYDENDNGIREANEAPAVGETIYLCDAETGDKLISAVVDVNGDFTVAGIAPGAYYLAFPLGEGLSSPKNGESFTQQGDMMVTPVLEVWQSSHYTGANLAIVRQTTLSGLAWLAMGDEVRAMDGVAVRLHDASGALLQETVSGADGRYAFDGLMPGDYRITADIPTGYAPIPTGEALLDKMGQRSIIRSVNGSEVSSGVITVRMAKHQTDLDIGAALPGKLGDRVWLDENGNGLQDGDEGGIPGVTIELVRDGEVIATTVSDQYGFYVFEDLYPTEYTLWVNWPDGLVPTQKRTDVGLIVSVLNEDGSTDHILVPSNGRSYDADLGFVLTDPDVLPEGYGEGETQNWKYKK